MTGRPNLNAHTRTDANHVPLTPLSFLSRTADVHPDQTAIIYGELNYSYHEMQARCFRLASALARRGITAGAAPAPSVITNVEKLGIDITHVHGLTEVYGPCVVCEAPPDWPSLGAAELAGRKARQGVRYATQQGMEVVDLDTRKPVPADGETIGEIVLRGNAVMKGYLGDEDATAKAFKGGWFSTGDLAVRHSDGYVQIRDRLKDIIISGGENVSTIEIEGVLYQHDDVLDAAVVAEPSEKWGETVCAFVEVKPGRMPSEEEIIAFCRDRLAGYKRPRRVVFCALPKTSTGKIQKFALRQKAKDLASQPA